MIILNYRHFMLVSGIIFFSEIQPKNTKRFKMINIVLFTPVIPLFIHLIKEVIQRF